MGRRGAEVRSGGRGREGKETSLPLPPHF